MSAAAPSAKAEAGRELSFAKLLSPALCFAFVGSAFREKWIIFPLGCREAGFHYP
jgi:hypothetical protein